MSVVTKCLAAVFVLLPVQSTGVAQVRQPVVTQIETIISELMTSQGIPGLSVAVANDNQLLYSAGFGMADFENSVPATSTTRYRTASIAKPMTAVAVLSLVEEQLIDLDAEVQHYCPEFPRKLWPVTSRHLLAHLGGIRHYRSRQESSSTQHFNSLSSALATFQDDPLEHQPGTKYLYSTFGYNLLGSVAEAAAQQDFIGLLEARVFNPAGMPHSVVDSQHSIVSGRARGYMRPTADRLKSFPQDHDLIAGELYNAALHDTSMKIPGGGLLSTAPDLVRFAVAVNTDRLLRADTRQQMWTEQQTDDGKRTGYGLGWRVGRHAGQHVVWHTGGQSGTSTVLVLFPASGTAVAIMCNLQDSALYATACELADVVSSPPATDYQDAIRKLQSAIRYEVQDKQLPAFSMALVDREQLIWADGFGFQDEEKQIPATAETVYRVGSISKLFTDIAVMQQVEHKKLALDTPIQTYLPEFKPHSSQAANITLRQLMSHQSGLVRESPVGHYFDPTEPSLAATVASLNDTELVYSPGTRTKYSNAAIAVVGAVLEKSLGTSHPESVRTTILEPLGMRHSSFSATPAIEQFAATGWMRTYDGRRFQAPEFLLGTGPAGNMFSSVLDLSKLLVCIFNEGSTANARILSPESLRLMTTPVQDAQGNLQDFGIGFHIQELDGEKKIGHGGAVYGFSTQLEALPERQIGVAAVAALDGCNGVVKRLSEYALRLMMATREGKSLPDYERSQPVAPHRAQELVGLYEEAEGRRLARITALAEKVYLQLGTYRYELRVTDDGEVVTDDLLGFGMELTKSSENQLTIGSAVFERLADNCPPDIPEHWRGLIGEYGWDHNTLYILEDHGQLVALIEWFYYYPLTEIDQDTYAFPDYGLYHGEGLKFSRDADSMATRVVAAEVEFQRRQVGTRDGETFKITPLTPIDELRAAAHVATPPTQTGEYRQAELVELTKLDGSIHLDIRYATTNNFMGVVFYQQPRAFLQRPAAEALVRVQQRLQSQQLGLLIHDAYRPWHVTKMFWDATPDDLKDFVANPANGSRHNRGCAVDLTLVDLASGQPIQMVAGYDEFSPRSFPLYPGGTSRQRWYRELLRAAMESQGFSVYEYEWWHFDYQDWQRYRIQNATFEELSSQ